MQQKGVTGNTIFFAQPTADIPSMEQPPPDNALVDCFSIIFTRNLQCLRNAWWATVKRAEYMRIARERRAECATLADVVMREDEAATRLPEDGVPQNLLACMQEVEGADKVPVRLVGPTSRAPDVGKGEEAGDESESGADSDGSCTDDGADQSVVDGMHENVAENTVALDPNHDVAPVRMMQALQGSLEALLSQAARIAKNERTPTNRWSRRCSSTCCGRRRNTLPDIFRAGRAYTGRVLRREDPN
ncbi:hypothetical protein N9L19_00475 [bacterium]|nr:hypothetical protein [bacterium]